MSTRTRILAGPTVRVVLAGVLFTHAVAGYLGESADGRQPTGVQAQLRRGTPPDWFAALAPRADPEVLPLLLEHGADLHALDGAGHGPLYWAVHHRNWEAAALLVERGAAWRDARLPDGQQLLQVVDAQRRRNPADAALTRLSHLLRAAPAAR